MNNDVVEIDLRGIINILKKNILVIIISTIICGAGAFGVSKFVMPQLYEATTTVIVNRNIKDEYKDAYAVSDFATSDLQYFREIANTYKEILTSKTVLNKIRKDFNIDVKYNEFSKKYVKVETLNNTEVIKLSIYDENPKKAMEMCNAVPKIFEKEVTRITKVAGIEVVDKATLPEKVEKPKVALFTIAGLVGGMLLGVVIVYFKYILDNKIKTGKDVEDKLNMKILGEVPKDKNIDEKIKGNNLDEYVLESYRRIRTNLEFSNIDSEKNAILFTSTQKGEGKTSTIYNTSLMFSRLENKKVVLIDCDLRKPKVHRLINLPNGKGVVDILIGKSTIEGAVNTINENFDIITAGQSVVNQIDILSSKKMEKFISDLKNRYDYVFIDTPPAGVFSDAIILSKLVDEAVFLIASNEIELENAKKAIFGLEKSGVKMVGCILNKVKPSDNSYGYYYYYEDDSKMKKSKFNKKVKLIHSKMELNK